MKIKALKDWQIVQGDFVLEIKKGEEIEVPEKYLPTLETESVIKLDKKIVSPEKPKKIKLETKEEK